MSAMSFGLLQVNSSPSPTYKVDGSGIRLWNTHTTEHSVPSTTPFRLHPEANTHHWAPQIVGWTVSSTATRTVQKSQPPASNILPSPTPSPLVVSVTSVSTSLAFTRPNKDVSSSVPLSSISTLLSNLSPQPTSLIIVASESIPTSSQAEVTASATEATTTVTSSVETASPSSSNATADDMKEGGHHAPFYIAVIVGSVFAIGLIAAIIAWAVRLRMHAKRRRENPEIPWTNYHGSDDGLEEGRDATFIGGPIDRIGSKDISSQDIIPWESRINRSVGELKRSDSCLPRSIHSNLVPPAGPYLDYQPYYPESVDSSIAYPPALHHGYARRTPYPDTMMDDHGSAASSLRPLKVTNRAPGDGSPASSFASSPVSMYTAPTRITSEAESAPQFLERYIEKDTPRLDERTGTENTWKTLPMLGETQKSSTEATSKDSSWTASLRSNLTHAFNSVAASLPSGPALISINKRDSNWSSDSLTPHPNRRLGSLDSIFSSKDQPWILEEHGNGTGRVHFPELEAEGDTDSSDTSIRRVSTRRTSLRPPQSAMLRHDTYLSGSLRRSESNASTNSVYSTASGLCDVAPRLPALSRQSSIRLDPMATVYENNEEDGNTFQPRTAGTLVKRPSSSRCSITEYYYSDDAGGKVTGSDETLMR